MILLDVGDGTQTLLKLPEGVHLYPAPGSRYAWLASVDGLVADGLYLRYNQHPHPAHPRHRWSCEQSGASRFYRTPGGAVRVLARLAREREG